MNLIKDNYLTSVREKTFDITGHCIHTFVPQALVSGNFFLPRYYIYHRVRNRSFVKNLGHRDFRVFSTRRTPAWRNGLTSSETTIIYLQNDV